MTAKSPRPLDKEELVRAIERRFHDLESPDHGWVAPAAAAHPFELLIEQLKAAGVFVREEAEMTPDHAVLLRLARGRELAVALLSLALPYAVFFGPQLLDPPADVPGNPWPEPARTAARVVQKAGLTLLGREPLEWEVPFRRRHSDEATCTLFQVLFDEHGPRVL